MPTWAFLRSGHLLKVARGSLTPETLNSAEKPWFEEIHRNQGQPASDVQLLTCNVPVWNRRHLINKHEQHWCIPRKKRQHPLRTSFWLNWVRMFIVHASFLRGRWSQQDMQTTPRLNTYIFRVFDFSPPARWGLLDFIRAYARRLSSSPSSSTSCPPRPPPRLRLANLANSSPSSLPTSQLSVHRWTSTGDLLRWVCKNGTQSGTCPAQCAPLDLNRGPVQLSVHRWTSTGDLPSSVCTAGPQPGTCPAQCAPLDLNRGPVQLSVHRWTSTWDLPSSVSTAGPQRPDRMPKDMPYGM